MDVLRRLKNRRTDVPSSVDFPHRRSSNKNNSASFCHFTAHVTDCRAQPPSFPRGRKELARGGQTNFRDRSLTRSTLVCQLGNIGIIYVYCHNFIPKLWPLSLPCLRNFCDITVFYNYLRAWKENNGNGS